jgi:glutaconate CoA-transferase subunit B
VVSGPEIFAYWLQGGRIDVGFLGAAQIDRYANLNTTVIGSYSHPKVRLPGAGGAPEIAAAAGEVFIMVRQNRRTFVDQLDFLTSVGYGRNGSGRGRSRGRGPTSVITDLGILEPDPSTKELTLTHLHPGVEVDRVKAETGWPLRIAPDLGLTEPPNSFELETLRNLKRRTAEAHSK